MIMESKERKPIWVFIMAGVLAFAILFFGMIYISNAKTSAIISEIRELRTEIAAIPEKAGEEAAKDTAAFTTLLLMRIFEAPDEPETIPLGPAEEAAAPGAAVRTEEPSGNAAAMEAEMSILDALISLPGSGTAEASQEADGSGWEDVQAPGGAEAAGNVTAEAEGESV